MTDAAKRRAILRAARRYQRLLGLGDWALTCHWSQPDDVEPCAAACIAKPEYREAELYFQLDRIPDGELEETVRHELLHVIVWPLAHAGEFLAGESRKGVEMVRLAHEAVVTHLEKAPFWRRLQ